MSLIEMIDPKAATGEVAAIFEQVQKRMGLVPNGLRAFAVSPHRLQVQVNEIGYYMAHPTLGPQLTAAIRYIVARDHGCEYCVAVNGGLLAQAGWSKEVVEALPEAPEAAPLEARDRAMLLTVVKAVRRPGEVDEGDVGDLRSLGWTDKDIFEAVAHGAFSIAFDTMLNVFKVRPEKR